MLQSTFSNTNVSKYEPNLLNLTDFCKGIAIVWIFIVHYQGGWFGWQGVHIFIVLSGFGLAYSCLKKNENPQGKAWYLKRFRRVLPVYWLVVLCSLPFLIVFQIVLGSEIWSALIRTFLDFLLLRNFFEQFMGGATGALWYIPFIISCYLSFPFLYSHMRKCSTAKGYLLIVLTVAAVEFLYRAVAIYWLDGLPISYDHKFLGFIPDSVSPLDRLPNWLFGIFQRRSPFVFFPSRIAEFTLGVVAAFAIVQNSQRLNKILLNSYMVLMGMLIWLAGQALLYVGLWGWIFADFVIALGLILLMLNLADFFQKTAPSLFQLVTWLGIWSYYIYLTHQPFTRVFRGIEIKLLTADANIFSGLVSLTLFGLTIASVYIASWLVMKFDRSRVPELVTQRMSRIISLRR